MLPSHISSSATARRRVAALPEAQGAAVRTGPISARRTLAHGVDGAVREPAGTSTVHLAVPQPASTANVARSSTGVVTPFTAALAGNGTLRLPYAQPTAIEDNRRSVGRAVRAFGSAIKDSLETDVELRHSVTLLVEESTYIITLSWRRVQLTLLFALGFIVLALSLALVAIPVAYIAGVKISPAEVAGCAFVGTVVALKFRLLRRHVYPAARAPLLPY